ncbi:MAG: hypothetical protein NZ518_08640, partial [Dehalococcoidia bacterium]|nr:hypothetical protein [Dehalococcoidia bacterium]
PTPRAAGVYRARVGFGDRLFDVGAVSLSASRAAPPTVNDPPVAVFGDQVAIAAVAVAAGPREASLPRMALVAPAQELRVDLAWQALRTPDDDYIAFVHLYGADGRRWAHLDQRPAGNLSAMTTWQVGDIIRDRRRFVVPLDIPAGVYRLEAGVYTPGGGPRLPTADGATTVELARLLVARPVAPPRVVVDVAFANGARLVGLDRTADGVRLVWRADTPIAGASTVFVHALDDHGAISAQADGVPASGAWPMDAWPVDTPIEDHRALPVTSRLRVGLYDPATGARVRTRDGRDAIDLHLAP